MLTQQHILIYHDFDDLVNNNSQKDCKIENFFHFLYFLEIPNPVMYNLLKIY